MMGSKFTASTNEGQQPHGTYAGALLLTTTILLFFTQQWVPILLVAALVLMAWHHLRSAPRRIEIPRTSSPTFWMLLLFVFYVIGVAWSTDMAYASFDLQVKATMLAVPLVLMAVPAERRSGGTLLLFAFREAAALAVLICVVVACWRYGAHWWGFHVSHTRNEPTTSYFISSNFSLFLHPSYFAMYLGFALASQDSDDHAPRSPWYRLLPWVLMFGIVLCGSKAGWIALVLYLVSMLVVHWRDAGERRRRIVFMIGGLAVLVALVMWSPFFQEKVGQFENVAHGRAPDVASTGSTESRELIWGATVQLIKEHAPWGTGTGDVKDVLLDRYAQLGYTHAVEEKLNAHNQWLQTTLTLGWPGLLLLFALIAVPLFHAIRRKDVLLIIFLGLLALNWATESMLETQAGVLFLTWGVLMLALRSSPPTEQRH